jgi:hypothetical protein
MSVLDLGGTPHFWEAAPVRPLHVTTVNLDDSIGESEADWLTHHVGDACEPPADVKSQSFDLVVSNSVLEHVGGHYQRRRLAAVIAQAAPSYWVQTPYRYFPVEPHWVFPFLQWLPFDARVKLISRWPFGNRRPSDRMSAIDDVHEIELLGRTQMKSYFPEAEIRFERIAGIPKSMIAIRRATI